MGKSLTSKAKKGGGGGRKAPKGLGKGRSLSQTHVIGSQHVGEDSLHALAKAASQLGNGSQAERPPQHERPKRKVACQLEGKQPAGHS